MRPLLAALVLWPIPAFAQPATPPPGQPSAPDAWVTRSTAELILLEKLRAQPSPMSVKVGQQAQFGTLTITVRNCAARPPDLPQNSAAFLEITDRTGAAPVFRGWILANTPAVSQLEHPIYDVRLVACK